MANEPGLGAALSDFEGEHEQWQSVLPRRCISEIGKTSGVELLTFLTTRELRPFVTDLSFESFGEAVDEGQDIRFMIQ